MNFTKNFKKLIKAAIREDLSSRGDITSKGIFENQKLKSRYTLIAKEQGILCGIELFQYVYKTINSKIEFKTIKYDGDPITQQEKICHIYGPVISLLIAERTSLNILAHLSGIATLTNKYVKKLNDSNIRILDTRKTLPGLRYLEKYAVTVGSGFNHRMGLYDMILVKDNHIDAIGSITLAVEKLRRKYKNKYTLEVECRTLDEVKESVKCQVDWIMLDNMDLNNVKKSIEIINKKCKIEISGDINYDSIARYQGLEIDYISIGKLTHSAKSFDFSLIKI